MPSIDSISVELDPVIKKLRQIDLTLGSRFKKILKAKKLAAFLAKILHPQEEGLLDLTRPIDIQLAKIWTLKESIYKALPSPKPHFFSM